MIELVSRKSVFEKIPKIGNEIHLIQKSMYEDCFTETGFPLTKNQLTELQSESDHLELKNALICSKAICLVFVILSISFSLIEFSK